MKEDLGQLQQRIKHIPRALNLIHEIHGNFRQLFDGLSSEWNDSTIDEKRVILQRFEEVGVTKERLRDAFMETYRKIQRPDIVAEAERSLRAIEAGSLLVT